MKADSEGNYHQKGHRGRSVLRIRRRCYEAEIRKENMNSVKGNQQEVVCCSVVELRK